MTATSPVNTRKDGIVGAIGILIILIGTATGSAYALLGMSVIALAFLAIFYREHMGRKSILIICAAAIFAMALVAAITKIPEFF